MNPLDAIHSVGRTNMHSVRAYVLIDDSPGSLLASELVEFHRSIIDR
jgi:hypothetical protein